MAELVKFVPSFRHPKDLDFLLADAVSKSVAPKVVQKARIAGGVETTVITRF
jgi:hypothetical protein